MLVLSQYEDDDDDDDMMVVVVVVAPTPTGRTRSLPSPGGICV